jgi:SPP1 family predicted phage head-tail adaptor
MRAGDLRHRVAIQTASESADTLGEMTKSWSTVATVWAALWPLRGAEREEAGQIKAQVSHRMRLRYNATLTGKHRLLLGTRVFNIGSVINFDERRHELELLVKEEV